MKAILSTILVCFLAATGIAQTTSTVNIIFRGITKTTNNYEVRIDDKRYFSNTNTNNATSYKITVNNLLTGTRALKVYKLRSNSVSSNANTQNTLVYSNNFVLRNGYDMNITIRANGAVQFSEVMSEITNPVGNAPMATATFNTLKQSIQAQWSQTLKAEKIRDAFMNTNNHFTSAQIRQLLIMVNSESDKLDLAKLAYAGITDQANFAALGNLFTSTARRNEFASFVRAKSEVTDTPSARALISDNNFTTLVNNVKGKWSQSLKGEALRNAFVNSNYYYTSAQLRELMGLVTSENDRMDLIKLAYPVVTDANNFALLYDVFASNENRTQFNEFVVANGGKAVNTGVKTLITAENFNRLIYDIDAKWSQALKTDAIRNAFVNSNNYFTSTQVRQLMGQVTSENDKMNLIKLAYPVVTDANNFALLYDVFASNENRTQFNEFVVANGGKAVNTGVKTLITAENFNKLIYDIDAKWSQALKTEAVRNAFVNSNNYFTTTQIRQLMGQVTSENDKMNLIKLAYPVVTDTNNFASLYDVFASTENRTEFNDFIVLKGGVAVNTGVKAQMTANNFNLLMSNIQSKWSQALKTDAVRDAFINTNNYFSTAQIRQLLTMVTSESDRLELAKQSFRSVMDPAQFYQLGDLFTSTAHRNEFNTYASTQSGVTVNATVRTPMSNGDFSVLVLTVRSNLLQILKVQAERDVFANPNNFFTTAQVKTLIGLINSESNRLELAKLSYKTVTDPENFTQLNDLFKMQASKDELAAYVNTYRVASN